MEVKEIEAIIKLLSDPDQTVYEHIEKKLLAEGKEIIKPLESAWGTSLDELLQSRIEHIIHKIQFDELIILLKAWLQEKSDDVLKGAFLISKVHYPSLDFQIVYQKIEKIKRNIWLELRDNFTPLEQIRVLNHVIYQTHKFIGNNIDFYSPQNCYINEVLETKKGNPISLAIIYLSIAKRLGLPIYGVNLPKNFILAYVNVNANINNISSIDEDNDILFYINPFNRGAVLGKKEIDFFLKQQKIHPERSYYVPCETDFIIQRLILNLIYSYKKIEQNEKADDFEKILNLFDNRLKDNRDLID